MDILWEDFCCFVGELNAWALELLLRALERLAGIADGAEGTEAIGRACWE